jgi:uncharacterized protein
MSRVIHFELPSTDYSASQTFYETVFGWKFTQYAGMDYWLISTGEPGAPGIDGALGGAATGMKATVVTIDVANIDESMRQIEASGGQLLSPKNEIPGVGWMAYFREPGGTVLGVFQASPNMGRP